MRSTVAGGRGRGSDELCGGDRHQVDVEHGRVLGLRGRRWEREVGGQLLVVPDAAGEGLGDPMELVEEDPCISGALGPVAGRGSCHQRVEVRRDAGHDCRRRRDVLVDVLVGHGDR